MDAKGGVAVKGRGWMERVTRQVNLPGEKVPGQPLLELFGDRRILVEHHQGVTEYGREKILIRVRYGHLAISGMDLELNCMSAEQLVITGRIFSVELLRR